MKKSARSVNANVHSSITKHTADPLCMATWHNPNINVPTWSNWAHNPTKPNTSGYIWKATGKLLFFIYPIHFISVTPSCTFLRAEIKVYAPPTAAAFEVFLSNQREEDSLNIKMVLMQPTWILPSGAEFEDTAVMRLLGLSAPGFGRRQPCLVHTHTHTQTTHT